MARAILECGTGLSTVLVAAIAKRRGLAHWALEHLPAWAAKAEDACRRHEFDTLVVSTADAVPAIADQRLYQAKARGRNRVVAVGFL